MRKIKTKKELNEKIKFIESSEKCLLKTEVSFFRMFRFRFMTYLISLSIFTIIIFFKFNSQDIQSNDLINLIGITPFIFIGIFIFLSLFLSSLYSYYLKKDRILLFQNYLINTNNKELIEIKNIKSLKFSNGMYSNINTRRTTTNIYFFLDIKEFNSKELISYNLIPEEYYGLIELFKQNFPNIQIEFEETEEDIKNNLSHLNLDKTNGIYLFKNKY